MTTPKTPDLAAVVRLRNCIDRTLEACRDAEIEAPLTSIVRFVCGAAASVPQLQADLAALRSGLANQIELTSQKVAEIAALRAERDQLQKELDGDCYHCTGYIKRNVVLHKDNAALRERLAVLEADTRRVDWMQRHHASIWWGGILERRKGPDPDAVALEWLDAGDLVSQAERFPNLRAAIDAALATRTPGAPHEAE